MGFVDKFGFEFLFWLVIGDIVIFDEWWFW